jgi:phage terminase large subunit GpA-like protein
MCFIVFFGTRQVVRDVGRPGAGGYQQCPRCGQYAQFRLRRARTWLHLFWIPLIPLGSATPILECGNCHLRLASTV